jgi:hypothetical protein
VGAVALERRGRRCGREGNKREGGGSGRGNATRRGTTSWGLAPTGGRRPDRVPAGRDPDAKRAGGALAPTERAPMAARAGRCGWRAGARGRPEKKAGWASPDEQ